MQQLESHDLSLRPKVAEEAKNDTSEALPVLEITNASGRLENENVDDEVLDSLPSAPELATPQLVIQSEYETDGDLDESWFATRSLWKIMLNTLKDMKKLWATSSKRKSRPYITIQCSSDLALDVYLCPNSL